MSPACIIALLITVILFCPGCNKNVKQTPAIIGHYNGITWTGSYREGHLRGSPPVMVDTMFNVSFQNGFVQVTDSDVLCEAGSLSLHLRFVDSDMISHARIYADHYENIYTASGYATMIDTLLIFDDHSFKLNSYYSDSAPMNSEYHLHSK